MILASGSAKDSRQCARYPATRGIAKRTVKYCVGKPIALYTSPGDKRQVVHCHKCFSTLSLFEEALSLVKEDCNEADADCLMVQPA